MPGLGSERDAPAGARRSRPYCACRTVGEPLRLGARLRGWHLRAPSPCMPLLVWAFQSGPLGLTIPTRAATTCQATQHDPLCMQAAKKH